MTRLLRLCDLLALGALAALLAVVAASVAGRALYDASGRAVNLMIPGAIELGRHALMVVVLAALPRAAAMGMVRVDLLVELLPPWLAGWLDRMWALAIAGFGGAAGWLLLAEAARQVSRGDATQDLALPLWPFTGFAGLMLWALAATGLWLAARGHCRGQRRGQHGESSA